MRPSLLVVLPMLLAPMTALAQDPAARVTCDAVAGTLVIEYVPDATELPDPEEARLVHFGTLLVLDEQETSVVDSRTHVQRCVLDSVELEVELAPLVSNVNLLGRCGGAYAGTVSVKRNGEPLLEALELEALNCHERERWLKRLTLRAGVAEPELEYSAYGDL